MRFSSFYVFVRIDCRCPLGVTDSPHGIIELYDDVVSRLVRIDFVFNAHLYVDDLGA